MADDMRGAAPPPAPATADTDAHASRALEAIDTALAEKPHREGATFTAATQHLCALRDGLLARRDAGADVHKDLCHVNAVISVILAGHFPLGEVPWKELKGARGWMADYVAGHV